MKSKNTNNLSILEKMYKMAIGDERIMVGEFLRKEFKISYFYKISPNVESIKVDVCSNDSKDYKGAIEEISSYVKEGKIELDVTNDIEAYWGSSNSFSHETFIRMPLLLYH